MEHHDGDLPERSFVRVSKLAAARIGHSGCVPDDPLAPARLCCMSSALPLDRRMALRPVRSLRMEAVRATLAGFPAQAEIEDADGAIPAYCGQGGHVQDDWITSNWRVPKRNAGTPCVNLLLTR